MAGLEKRKWQEGKNMGEWQDLFLAQDFIVLKDLVIFYEAKARLLFAEISKRGYKRFILLVIFLGLKFLGLKWPR